MTDRRNRDAHKELQKIMRDAAESYYAKEIEEYPELDLSFMKKTERVKKNPRRIKRYAGIAAGIAIVFFVGTTVSSLLSGDAVYGDKGLLHRLYQSVMGVDTDQQDAALTEEYTESFETGDMDDIDDAVDFSGRGLYVPDYLPEGYRLELLSVEKEGDGSLEAFWELKNGEKKLNIVEIYTGEADDGTVSAGGEGKLIRMKDRVIYAREEDSDGERSVAVFTEDAMIDIYGAITEEEGIRIAKGLSIQK